jgi:hypothetical protein
MTQQRDLRVVRDAWRAEWPHALALWSRFTMLREPSWCLTRADEKREKLAGSFAMIRLSDHTVVISLAQIAELGLEDYPREVMAHEIGHHVYCPADLTDDAKLMARIRAALPTREAYAGLVSNLYTDLLINDRLTRAGELRMGDLYLKLAGSSSSRLWTFYMRVCEILWSREKGSLARGGIDGGLEADAMLGARVIRAYASEWLRGAGRFAALCFTYLDEDAAETEKALRQWLDAHGASEGGLPDGLAEIDPDEIDGAIHPSLDEALSGVPSDEENESGKPVPGGGATETGDPNERRRYREPSDYADILRSVGVALSEDEIVSRYYRERALPHLVRFPTRELPQSTEPLPEGVEPWDVGESLEDLDLLESVMQSPQVIPGATTLKRVYGTMEGTLPARDPLDLYVGIDCSGSMGNPRHQISWPILAGTIVALSALRAGSRVKVVLSGEPGSHTSTDGFTRVERDVLKTLTSYLGTGYAFGIHRLAETFDARKPADRPVHALIVTDHDIFAMLKEKRLGTDGWAVARRALENARGGGTYVLHMSPEWEKDGIGRMKTDGWNVATILTWEDIVAFAREFSRANFGPAPGGRRG